MIESKIIIHWNVKTSTLTMQDINGSLRAVLDNEVKKNTLSYRMTGPDVV